MLAEKIPTYEEWYEDRCNIGYYADDEYVQQEADWALDEILVKAGLKGVMYRNTNGRDISWCVGSHGSDYVAYDIWVDVHKVPKQHPLRTQYPFAFLAQDLDFAYEHHIDLSRGRTIDTLEPVWQWSYEDYANADDDTPFEEGTVYDGMTWDVIAQLMSDQTDALMDVFKDYADDACYVAQCSLAADYDYFFSEERYKEEYDQ